METREGTHPRNGRLNREYHKLGPRKRQIKMREGGREGERYHLLVPPIGLPSSSGPLKYDGISGDGRGRGVDGHMAIQSAKRYEYNGRLASCAVVLCHEFARGERCNIVKTGCLGSVIVIPQIWI